MIENQKTVYQYPSARFVKSAVSLKYLPKER
mgnify:CR=1 FL=1